MAKHTPGPWHVAGNYRGWRTVQDAAGDIVTFAQQKPHEETMQADLRLIAAAPDLLEALKNLVEAHYWADYWAGGGHHNADRDIERARAAIAKAEGK